MVMGAIAILTVMLAEFQDETSAELAAATAQRDALQAEYMAKSAVNLSRLLIASEPTMRKAIAPLFMLMKKTPPQLPVWEFSDRLLGAFNDEEAQQGLRRHGRRRHFAGQEPRHAGRQVRARHRRRGLEDQRQPRRGERHRSHPSGARRSWG